MHAGNVAVLAVGLCSLFGSVAGRAATWYVAPGGDGTAGTNWVTAKQTIQAAIDLAASNDVVLVSNGVYATGGRVVYGALTNRVALTNAITVRSVNGADVTHIVGAPAGSGSNGNAAIRCVYVGSNATLAGLRPATWQAALIRSWTRRRWWEIVVIIQL